MNRKALYRGIVISLTAAVAVGAALLWRSRSIEVTVAAADAVPVNEMEAVGTTREALAAGGIDPGALEPVPYSSSSRKLFAQNDLDQTSGYVLWRVRGSGLVWDYLVRCEWQAAQAKCQISRPH